MFDFTVMNTIPPTVLYITILIKVKKNQKHYTNHLLNSDNYTESIRITCYDEIVEINGVCRRIV